MSAPFGQPDSPSIGSRWRVPRETWRVVGTDTAGGVHCTRPGHAGEYHTVSHRFRPETWARYARPAETDRAQHHAAESAHA